MEDSEEATLVQKFKMNMGDYKLKTASDYVVPKHQRVTFSKKKRSLLLLRNKVSRSHTPFPNPTSAPYMLAAS